MERKEIFYCNLTLQKGKDYLNDKSNASSREVKIAIELFGSLK